MKKNSSAANIYRHVTFLNAVETENGTISPFFFFRPVRGILRLVSPKALNAVSWINAIGIPEVPRK